MAVIKEYKQGECKIIVHDDYICAPEDVGKIIDNVSRIIWNDLRSREIRKSREENKKEIE